MNKKQRMDDESRSVVKLIVLVFTGMLAVLLLQQVLLWQHVQQSFQKREAVLIGKLVTIDSSLEPTIMGALKGISPTQPYEQIGATIMEKYGYYGGVDLPSDQRFYSPFLWQSLIITLIIMVAATLLFFFLFRTLRAWNQRIAEISLTCERVMNGNFHSHLPANGEGELAILTHQFNMLTRRLQLTLSELYQEKDRMKLFISDVSHQLKTPLASLKIYQELLIDGADQDKAVRYNFLQRGYGQIERMEWLTQTLLTMSRMEAGAIQLEPKEQSIMKTVTSSVHFLTEKAQKQGVTLTTIPSSNNVMVDHDRSWMEECLVNILDNAITYSKQGESVTITVQQAPETATIIIKDKGIGISEQDLPYIFERFYQGRKKGSDRKGTGIGLALSKQIVDLHQGIIRVYSTEGEGTSFVITLWKQLEAYKTVSHTVMSS